MRRQHCLSMPRSQLRYLGACKASESIDAEDVEEAESLARMRLLFHDPGFAIAVMLEGVELSRLVQGRKRSASPSADVAV